MLIDQRQLKDVIDQELTKVRVLDLHTHLFPAAFDRLALWGIDEILTYHYLISEFFRFSDMQYDSFFRLPKVRQADLIWQTLFVEHSPVSEAQRGVLTILKRLGLDVGSRSLAAYRDYFGSLSLQEQIDRTFELAGIEEVVMTNDPFDSEERDLWNKGLGREDPRFKAALRMDPLLVDLPTAIKVLQAEGYEVDSNLSGNSLAEVRRFLKDWILRIDALYLAVSLPPDFNFEDDPIQARLLQKCILPICQEFNLPFALMIGVKKRINKPLGLAGDSVGKADIRVIEKLCTDHPHNRFLVTMLSRENQHELAITARKYRNLMVFGCWWFLNNPSLVREITNMRFETLGLSFIPQHSDARVLEHLIYKWEHAKMVIGRALLEKYTDLLATGWQLSKNDVARDVKFLFQGNANDFLAR